MPTVGAGRNATEAYAPWITKVKGVKIAFIGMSQIAELSASWAPTGTRPGVAMAFDRDRAVAAVKAAQEEGRRRRRVHALGVRGHRVPQRQQKSFASTLADAGATLIVGVHAHLLQGGGWLGKTYVEYGMGNFLWWRDDAWSNDTGVLRSPSAAHVDQEDGADPGRHLPQDRPAPPGHRHGGRCRAQPGSTPACTAAPAWRPPCRDTYGAAWGTVRRAGRPPVWHGSVCLG